MNNLPPFSNCTTGTHASGNITYLAEGPLKSRYLFGTLAEAPGKVTLAGTAKRALGVITDEADRAGDPVNMAILGSQIGTLKVLAGASIKRGESITANEDSQAVSLENAAAGTYFVYGIALTDAEAGALVEFTPSVGLTQTITA